MFLGNEFLFLVHILVVLAFTLVALRIGPEALTAAVAIQMIFANLFVLKEMEWFGYEITCSDAFIVGAALALNLLHEYYGGEKTRTAIITTFVFSAFFMIFGLIIVGYVPSGADSFHPQLASLFVHSPRIITASLLVALVMQLIDWKLYGYVNHLTHHRWLVGRNIFLLMGTQFLDTLLFSYFGLSGIVHNIWHVIWVSFGVKVLFILLAGPAIEFSRRLAEQKKSE